MESGAEEKKDDRAPAPSPEKEDEMMCRYCFEGDSVGELISPCQCAGGQKYVHLTCLRMWQRAVLGAQPTHPDLYDTDVRQRVCNVCKTEFTCAPPTRAELMASFTGPELAALIEESSLIGSAKAFSDELEQQLSAFPEDMRDSSTCRHWIRGVFLIVRVVEDRRLDGIGLRVTDAEDLESLAGRLAGPSARSLHLRGRRYILLPKGPLRDVLEDAPPERWREAVRSLTTPATLELRPEAAGDCGEDGIVAVNLTRQFDLRDTPSSLMRMQQRASFCPEMRRVQLTMGELTSASMEVTHLVGGPCEEETVCACLVLAEGKYQIVKDDDCLREGLKLAAATAHRLVGARNDRTIARLTRRRATLRRRLPLLSARAKKLWASALRRKAPVATRAEVRRKAKRKAPKKAVSRSDSGKVTLRSKPALRRNHGESESSIGDATPASSSARKPVQLLVCWGYAGWSRCQLMGEIAKGSWGLCQSTPTDVASHSSGNLWSGVYPRMMLAPKNDMSESYGGQAPEEEARRQEMRRMALFYDIIRRNRAVTGFDADALDALVDNEDSSDDDEDDEMNEMPAVGDDEVGGVSSDSEDHGIGSEFGQVI